MTIAPRTKALIQATCFLLAMGGLTFDFLYDPLHVITERSWFENYQISEVAAVRRTMERAEERGFWNSCGMLHETDSIIYTSQPGLAGFAPALLRRFVPIPLDSLMQGYAIATAAMLALAFTLFAFLAGREFGWPVTIVVLGLTSISHPMIAVGRNVWWLFHLCLWPFIAAWILSPRLLAGRIRKWLFLLVIGLLVFIKATAGYVFITNVILGATIGPLYFALKERLPLRQVLRLLAQVVAVGVAGFLLAIAVNVVQTTCHYGSLKSGVRVIYEKAAARTVGPDSQLQDLNRTSHDAAPPHINLRELLGALMHVRAMRYTLGIPQFEAFLGWFLLSIPILLIAAIGHVLHPRDDERQRERTNTAILLGWSLACTWTWPLMALGFTYHHAQLTGLSFYVTYMPVLFVTLGRFLMPHRADAHR